MKEIFNISRCWFDELGLTMCTCYVAEKPPHNKRKKTTHEASPPSSSGLCSLPDAVAMSC